MDQSSSSTALAIEDRQLDRRSTVVHQSLSDVAAAASSSSAAAEVHDASLGERLRRRLQGGRSGTPPRLNPASPTLWPTGVPSPNSVWHGRRPEPSAAAAARVPDPEQMVLITRTGRRYHNIIGCPHAALGEQVTLRVALARHFRPCQNCGAGLSISYQTVLITPSAENRTR